MQQHPIASCSIALTIEVLILLVLLFLHRKWKTKEDPSTRNWFFYSIISNASCMVGIVIIAIQAVTNLTIIPRFVAMAATLVTIALAVTYAVMVLVPRKR